LATRDGGLMSRPLKAEYLLIKTDDFAYDSFFVARIDDIYTVRMGLSYKL
jgi:hypothetical protein